MLERKPSKMQIKPPRCSFAWGPLFMHHFNSFPFLQKLRCTQLVIPRVSMEATYQKLMNQYRAWHLTNTISLTSSGPANVQLGSRLDLGVATWSHNMAIPPQCLVRVVLPATTSATNGNDVSNFCKALEGAWGVPPLISGMMHEIRCF